MLHNINKRLKWSHWAIHGFSGCQRHSSIVTAKRRQNLPFSVILVSLHQRFVLLVKLYQFIMCSHFYYPTAVTLILQNTDTIGPLDGAEAMGNDNRGTIATALCNQLVETFLNWVPNHTKTWRLGAEHEQSNGKTGQNTIINNSPIFSLSLSKADVASSRIKI